MSGGVNLRSLVPRPLAGAFFGLDRAIGDRSNVDVGAAGRDKHEIGERCLAAQIDGDDVLRLGVFQACQHRVRELTGVLLLWLDRRGKRRICRFVLGRECQRSYPPAKRRVADARSRQHDPS